MSDVWLVGWAVLGVVAAYTFAAGGVLHARRTGRRWHESVLASQSYATAVCAGYVMAWVFVGPVWGLLLAPGLLTTAFALALLAQVYAEHKAKKAVFARECGE